MRLLFLFVLVIGSVLSATGQKNTALKPLKKIYGKDALNAFEKEHGDLDLLYYAYDHAINVIQNNGGKNIENYPKAPSSDIVHFTDLGVKIEPFTQYFQSEVPNQLIAIKSLYQLTLEFNESKTSKH